jgi:hypothetical protein
MEVTPRDTHKASDSPPVVGLVDASGEMPAPGGGDTEFPVHSANKHYGGDLKAAEEAFYEYKDDARYAVRTVNGSTMYVGEDGVAIVDSELGGTVIPAAKLTVGGAPISPEGYAIKEGVVDVRGNLLGSLDQQLYLPELEIGEGEAGGI